MQDEAPLEIVTSDALGALERSQIDMQISTAKKYPRSVKAFMEEAQSMIALNQETAEACNYKLKRKEKGGGIKYIEGPSIRLLEIAASCYTNLRYGSRIIGIDGEFVTAQGMAFDLQKNVAQTVETKRSIQTRDGMRYGTDMIMVTANAAGSIARRNALNGLIPRAYIMHLSDYAKQIAVGDIKSLPERRQRAFDYFTKVLGVDVAKVLAYLEKPSVEDCGLAELEDLSGLKTLLKENEITLEQAFDPKEETAEKVPTPDLSKPSAKPVTPPAPGPAPAPVAAAAPVAAEPEPVATTTTTATTPRRKKVKEAAPEPTPAAAPVAEAPKEPAEDPMITLARKLDENGVTIDDFFDWLKSSGRDNIYHFDADAVETMKDLPEKLVTDLLVDDTGLNICIRIFGKKKA